MKEKLNSTTIVVGIMILSLAYEVIAYREINFLHTTNITFLISAIFLLIGLFWATLASGFFDVFHYSVKKVSRSLKKNSHHTDEEQSEESSEIQTLSNKVGKGYYVPLKIGFSLLFICLLTLMGYYIFEQ